MRFPSRNGHPQPPAGDDVHEAAVALGMPIAALPDATLPDGEPPAPALVQRRPGIHTYRGRTLDELLPRIRTELGPDAVVLREREGLMGGVGGFFQKRFVEVEAVAGGMAAFDALDGGPADPAPAGGEPRRVGPEAYAAAPGASLLEDAAPFLAHLDEARRTPDSLPPELEREAMPGLAAAETRAALEAADYAPGARAGSAFAPAPAPAYPFADDIAPRPAGPPATPVEPDEWEDIFDEAEDDELDLEDDIAVAMHEEIGAELGEPPARGGEADADAGAPASEDSPAAAAAPPAPELPAPARRALKLLVASGISEAMAADVVGEAVAHRLPFAPRRRLKGVVREALAARLPVAGPAGPGPRVVAFVGTSGAGRSHAAARLAAAYAQASDLPVACVALAPRDGGAGLATALRGTGVSPVIAGSAAEARIMLGDLPANAVVVIDAPAFRPRDPEATRALGDELAQLGVTERHLVVPVTLSARSVRELVAGAAPLGPTALALTRTDETEYLGAGLELAAATGTPVSWIAWGADAPGGLEPATPDGLAAMVLP